MTAASPSSAPSTASTGKSSAAPPKLTTNGRDVELDHLKSSSGDGSGNGSSRNASPLPIEEDIMQLARLGEVDAIRKLFDSGKYDVKHCDEEGITPLHVGQPGICSEQYAVDFFVPAVQTR